MGMAACACDPSTAGDRQRQEEGWVCWSVALPQTSKRQVRWVRDCLEGIRQEVIQEDPSPSPMSSSGFCMHMHGTYTHRCMKKARYQLCTALVFTHPSP